MRNHLTQSLFENEVLNTSRNSLKTESEKQNDGVSVVNAPDWGWLGAVAALPSITRGLYCILLAWETIKIQNPRQLLPNVSSLHTIIKLKIVKLNHCKSGTISMCSLWRMEQEESRN